jgi:hypothetical protein
MEFPCCQSFATHAWVVEMALRGPPRVFQYVIVRPVFVAKERKCSRDGSGMERAISADNDGTT